MFFIESAKSSHTTTSGDSFAIRLVIVARTPGPGFPQHAIGTTSTSGDT